MNLKDLRIAIKAAKRMGGKTPVPLTNFAEAQMYLEMWQKKLKLAQTKVKKYRRKVERYNRIYGGDNARPGKDDVDRKIEHDV